MTKLFIGVPRGEAPSEAFISSIGRLQKRTLAAEVWLDTRRNLEVCGQKFGKCSVSFVPHSRDGGLDYFVVNTKLDNVLASILSKYARGVFLQVSIAHSEMSLRIMPLVSIEIGYPSLVDCFSALAEFCRVRSVGEDEKELFERGPLEPLFCTWAIFFSLLTVLF